MNARQSIVLSRVNRSELHRFYDIVRLIGSNYLGKCIRWNAAYSGTQYTVERSIQLGGIHDCISHQFTK